MKCEISDIITFTAKQVKESTDASILFYIDNIKVYKLNLRSYSN